MCSVRFGIVLTIPLDPALLVSLGDVSPEHVWVLKLIVRGCVGVWAGEKDSARATWRGCRQLP